MVSGTVRIAATTTERTGLLNTSTCGVEGDPPPALIVLSELKVVALTVHADRTVANTTQESNQHARGRAHDIGGQYAGSVEGPHPTTANTVWIRQTPPTKLREAKRNRQRERCGVGG